MPPNIPITMAKVRNICITSFPEKPIAFKIAISLIFWLMVIFIILYIPKPATNKMVKDTAIAIISLKNDAATNCWFAPGGQMPPEKFAAKATPSPTVGWSANRSD